MDMKTEVSNIAKARCQNVALQLIHMCRHRSEKSQNVNSRVSLGTFPRSVPSQQ